LEHDKRKKYSFKAILKNTTSWLIIILKTLNSIFQITNYKCKYSNIKFSELLHFVILALLKFTISYFLTPKYFNLEQVYNMAWSEADFWLFTSPLPTTYNFSYYQHNDYFFQYSRYWAKRKLKKLLILYNE